MSSSTTKDSIPPQIQILRFYLEAMERSIKTDDEKYQAEKVELHNQARELQKQIEEERNKQKDLTEDEREAMFDQAYESWFNRTYFSYDDRSYEDSTEYQLHLVEDDIYYHSFWDLSFDFSLVLRSSFFTHVYSFIEHQLNETCEKVRVKKRYSLSLKDPSIKGTGIFRAKNYLLMAASIDLSGFSEWADILNYNKVRNCIVHANGFIALSRDAPYLQSYIPKVDLAINHGKIEIKEAYCRKALDTIEKFFDDLEKRIAAL